MYDDHSYCDDAGFHHCRMHRADCWCRPTEGELCAVTLAPGQWGHTLEWPCGHAALVIGEHDLWHSHFCPICLPGQRDPGCDVEYLDPHVAGPGT